MTPQLDALLDTLADVAFVPAVDGTLVAPRALHRLAPELAPFDADELVRLLSQFFLR